MKKDRPSGGSNDEEGPGGVDEALYKEKTARVSALIQRGHQVMGDTIASLAKQFTPDERKVLAEMLAKSKPHRRWSSHRQRL